MTDKQATKVQKAIELIELIASKVPIKQTNLATPPTHIVPKYLGDSELLKADLLTSMVQGGRVSLAAPAGSGKSHVVLRYLMPELTKLGYTVIFACPFVSQRDQVKEQVVKNELDIYVYTPTDSSAVQADISKAMPATACTYDRLEQVVVQMSALNEAQGGKTILIIDESQFLTKSRSFRKGAITDIERALLFANLHAVLFISATPNTALESHLKFKIIKVEREKNPRFNFAIRLKTNAVQDLVNEIIYKLERGVKAFVLVNNYPEIILRVAKALIELKVLKEDEINIFTGDTIKEQTPEKTLLSEKEVFADGVRVVFATDVLKQAINVQNENFELIYYPQTLNDIDPRDIIQFVNRLRFNIGNCIDVNCTLFLHASFITGVRENKYVGEKTYLWLKAKNSFDSVKQVAQYKEDANATQIDGFGEVTTNSKLYEPVLSPIYDYNNKLHYSILAPSELAEKYRLKNLLFVDNEGVKRKDGVVVEYNGLVNGLADLSPVDTVFIGVAHARRVSIDSGIINAAIGVATAAAKEITTQAKKDVLSDWETSSLLMLSYFAANSQKARLARKLNVPKSNIEPQGLRRTDPRIYMQTLESLVGAYVDNHYTNEQLGDILSRNIMPAKERPVGCVADFGKARLVSRLANMLIVLHLHEKKMLPDLLKNLLFSTHSNYRYSLNLLAELIKELRKQAIDKDAKALLERDIKQAKQAAETDKKNKGRHLTKLSGLQAKQKNLTQNSQHSIGLSDLLYNIKCDNKYISASNISTDDIAVILQYFTSVRANQQRGRGDSYTVRADMRIEFGGYATVMGQSVGDAKRGLIQNLYNNLEQATTDEIFNATPGGREYAKAMQIFEAKCIIKAAS